MGERVRAFAGGDRVVVPFQINCGGCRACRELYLIVLAQYASICLTSASGSAT